MGQASLTFWGQSGRECWSSESGCSPDCKPGVKRQAPACSLARALKASVALQDAMETTAQSGDSDIAEELLRFFVEQKEKECFAAMLYTCYEFIKPDVALEVSCVAVSSTRLGNTNTPFLVPLCVAMHAWMCKSAMLGIWGADSRCVLQLAWLNGLTEFIMPYMVQTIKEMTGKVR